MSWYLWHSLRDSPRQRSFDVVDGRNIIPLPLLNWYEHLGDGMSLWTWLSFVFCRNRFLHAGTRSHLFVGKRLSLFFVKFIHILVESWEMTIHERDPSFVKDLTRTSIPHWSEWYATLTSSNGPTCVCPGIHPVGQESSSSRGDLYSRHAPALPPTTSSKSWTVTKHLSGRNLSHEPAVLLAWIALYVLYKRSDVFPTGFPVRERWSTADSLKSTRLQVSVDTPNCSFIFATGFHLLENEWSEICWTKSSHQSEVAPWTLSRLTELVVRNNNSAVDKSPL